VEISEETLVADAGRARQTLAALHEIGASVSIDDYGVGYSSLSYLRDLPADELKLDRSFITALGTDPRATALVRYTVELAHALDVAVVAEGVEDAGTLRVLEQLRCDRVQGHYVAKPMDARHVTGWLRQRAAPAGRTAAAVRTHDGDFTRVQVTLEP
jgi:EAL domain-containing protein (putative c-di-GMP-specific phosphodiesterase class I)